MTKKELEQMNAELQASLRQLLEAKEKPFKIVQFWNWFKHYIIPLIVGMIVGLFIAHYSSLTTNHLPLTTIEQQAASGGAAIPFPSGTPSPTPSTSLPQDSTAESTASSWMSTFEPPSPSNPQADSGQTNSQRSYRQTLLRRR